MKIKEKQTANRSTSRIINRRAVFEHILSKNGVGRTDVAKNLNLSKPAVNAAVAELIEIGLIEESGVNAKKSAGPKQALLRFRENYSFIAVIDISYTKPICALGDLGGNILERERLLEYANAQERLDAASNAIHELLKRAKLASEDLELVIISQPGIITNSQEVLYVNPRHHNWTEIGLKERLIKTLNKRVIIENCARLAAMGELEYCRLSEQTFIYIDCGVGLGSAFIQNGRPYEGHNRASGEIGHIALTGGRFAEEEMAMEGLLRRIFISCTARGLEAPKNFEEVINKIENDDKVVCATTREIGRDIGRLIYNCAVLFDAPTVIFGGEYLRLGAPLFEGIHESIHTDFPFRPKIMRSSLEDNAEIEGAFVLGRNIITSELLNSED